MKNLLARHWFLLLLIGGISLGFVAAEPLEPYAAALPPVAAVAAALFLMAWSLESRSLFRTLFRPLPALWAVFISYGLVPVIAWLAGIMLPESLRIGLLISASVPCTLASAVIWTRRAGGNEATALLVILLTTATSWLVTTGWLAWGTGVVNAAFDSAKMMRDLLFALVLPVALGQLARTLGPLARAASRHKTVIGVIAQLLILLIIVKAAVGVNQELRQAQFAVPLWPLLGAAAACLGTHLAAWAMGLWSSGLWHFDRPSRIAVAFAGSQKTLPVALLLFEAYFKDHYPLALFPLVFYHFGQLIVDTFLADKLVSRPRTEAEPAVEASL